jgi:predicted transposase/invertase (TIGR01784 family)
LRYFFEEADSIFDLTKIEYLDKELEQLFPVDEDDFHPKYVDKLLKVNTLAGEEQWILVHIEVQGSKDEGFAERMFTYFYRIYEKYKRPIAALAILTDSNKNFRPNRFEKSFLSTKIQYDYKLIKVLDLDEKELIASSNPFAMVVLVAKKALNKGKLSQDEMFSLKIELAKTMLQKGFTQQKIRTMMNFLKFYVRFENKDFNSKFESSIDELSNKIRKPMGIEEFILTRAERKGELKGEKRGELTSKTLVIENLIQKMGLSNEQVANIAEVSIEFVEKIRLKLNTKH